MDFVSSSNAFPPLLLVEDGPLALLSAKAALEEEGYRVVAVRHSGSALMALGQIVSGLITDIRLPGSTDGWEIARAARQRWPDLPVIYVTGEGDENWVTEGVENSLILQKPFTSARLIAAVEQLVPKLTAVQP